MKAIVLASLLLLECAGGRRPIPTSDASLDSGRPDAETSSAVWTSLDADITFVPTSTNWTMLAVSCGHHIVARGWRNVRDYTRCGSTFDHCFRGCEQVLSERFYPPDASDGAQDQFIAEAVACADDCNRRIQEIRP